MDLQLFSICLDICTRTRKDNIYERFLGIPFKGNNETFHEASPIFYINDVVESPTFDVKFLLEFYRQQHKRWLLIYKSAITFPYGI